MRCSLGTGSFQVAGPSAVFNIADAAWMGLFYSP